MAILARLELQCDPAYYPSGSSCLPIPAVAHGHYQVNILNRLELSCDGGYYPNGDSCLSIPRVAHVPQCAAIRLFSVARETPVKVAREEPRHRDAVPPLLREGSIAGAQVDTTVTR